MGMTNKRAGSLILIFLVAIVTVYVFMGGSPSIALEFEEDSFTASVAEYDMTIFYDEIVSLNIIDTPAWGDPENGGEKRGFRYGVWQNDTLGRYTQCTTSQSTVCILFDLKNADPFLLSIESNSSTIELHSMVTGLLRSKGYDIGAA